MSDLEQEVRDDYFEHELHPRPWWKQMKTCSTCYEKHTEFKRRSNLERGGGREPIESSWLKNS